MTISSRHPDVIARPEKLNTKGFYFDTDLVNYTGAMSSIRILTTTVGVRLGRNILFLMIEIIT